MNNKFQIKSIQARLSLILILTITAIFAGFALYNYFTTKSDMDTELYSLTDSLAKQLSESLKYPLWDYAYELVEKIVDSEMLEKQVYAILVKNESGDILYGKMRDNNWNLIETNQKIIGNYYVKSETLSENDREFGTVEIFLSPEFMQKKLKSSIVNILIVLIILDILLVSMLFVSIGKSVINPVSRLAESVRIIASGQLDRAVHSEREDEIGQLASDVEKMRLAIKDLTENLETKVRERTEQLRETKDALWSEMELAKKIQTVLLPEKPEISGYDIAASLEPADEVGGDYYDVIYAGGYDWIVIGDVTGHGVAAGLVMMMVQTAVHTVLLVNPEVPPSQLLSDINRTIYKNVEKMGDSKHMTIVVLAGGRCGDFTFAGLHEDILVRRAGTGKVEKIETKGMWIGLEPEIDHFLSEDSLKLEPGDCMILFTDGITEAVDKNGDLFGDDFLVRIIEKSIHNSASAIHKNIIDALKPYDKPDDVTLVVIKRV